MLARRLVGAFRSHVLRKVQYRSFAAMHGGVRVEDVEEEFDFSGSATEDEDEGGSKSSDPTLADATPSYAASKENYFSEIATNYSRHPEKPPADLVNRINTVLEGRSRKRIRERANDMAKALEKRAMTIARELRTDEGEASVEKRIENLDPLLYGPWETLGYLGAHALPRFGTGVRVFRELKARLPDFEPRSMLDFGSGTGIALWCAREVWPNSVREAVFVEPSRAMTQVSEHLHKDFYGIMYHKTLNDVERRYTNKTFDLVVAHYTLGELVSDKDREAALANLWKYVAPGGSLVLMEEGTRWGFRVIKNARQSLINSACSVHPHRSMPEEVDSPAGVFEEDSDDSEWTELEEFAGAVEVDGEGEGSEEEVSGDAKPGQQDVASGKSNDRTGLSIVGPCPHALECPMHRKSWCFFAQNTRAHAVGKKFKNSAELAPTVEKFSYFIARKTTDEQALQHPPMQRAGYPQSLAALGPTENDEDGVTDPSTLPDGWYLSSLRPDRVAPPQTEIGKEMDELSGATSLVQRAGMGNDEESADPSFLETLRAELPRGSDGAVSKEEEERLMEWLKQTGLLEDDTSTTGEKEKGDDVGEIKEEYPFTHEGKLFNRPANEEREIELESAMEDAIAAGLPGAGQFARILRPPIKAKKQVILDLCTPQGTMERRNISKGKMKKVEFAYKTARKSQWGAFWPNWIK